MISISIINTLRENHDEVIRRWLEGMHGCIAEDFEEMMLTPMGNGVANKLFGYAVEFLGAEAYEELEVLHKVQAAARDASYRRAAVGFGLTDIVVTALSFRKALNETLTNHVTPSSAEDSSNLLAAVLALNRFGDTMVSGDIAGFFACRDFTDSGGEAAA